jgi:hypothetical protein
MTIATDLHDVTVLDTEGRVVALDSFWKEQPVVLVFVRHYG